MATGSNFTPSVHFCSHWSSCGQTRPQMAGSTFLSKSVWNAPSKSCRATWVMNVGMSISTGQPAMHGRFLHSMQRSASRTASSSV